MDLGIEGRTAAVAAASTGLGFAVANALAAEGVTVAICGRDAGRIAAAADRIGHGAIGLVVDVSTPDGGAEFVAASTEALGGSPEILVANGGGPPVAGFDDATLDQYRAALDANLLASIAMCQAAIPAMRETGWGRVVAITSATVKMPSPYLALSNTARAGLHGFLKTTATAVAADGVTVNGILPGLHDTDRVTQLYRKIDDGGGDERQDRDVLPKAAGQTYGGAPDASGIPVGEIGSPEDFGDIAAFLCSDQARFITGASIPVDGGAYPGLL